MDDNFKKGFIKEAGPFIGAAIRAAKFVGKKLFKPKKLLGAAVTGAFVVPEIGNVIKKTKKFGNGVYKPLQNLPRHSSVSNGIGQTLVR